MNERTHPSEATPQPYRLDARIELTKPPEPRKGINWLAWLQASTPIVVAIVGLYFTDTIRTGLERQQLQLANASGMQALFVQLLGANVSTPEAQAAASTLATFGPPAVAPLVTALIIADDVRMPEIESALRAIGFNHADAVCAAMISILEHRTGRYSLPVLRSAIRVIGDVRCQGAPKSLEMYRSALANGTLKVFNPATGAWTTPPLDDSNVLKTEIDQALSDDR